MTRLRSTLVRTGAIVALIALVMGPPILVAALIGRASAGEPGLVLR